MKLHVDLSSEEWDALRAALTSAVLREQYLMESAQDEDLRNEASRDFVFLRNLRDHVDDLVDAYNSKYGVDPR